MCMKIGKKNKLFESSKTINSHFFFHFDFSFLLCFHIKAQAAKKIGSLIFSDDARFLMYNSIYMINIHTKRKMSECRES